MFDYEDAMGFINSFTKAGNPVKDLSRISGLLDILGNPQDKLKCIHIAGTNGKGSVAQMCTEILIASGYKTATYTSPYIIEYRDRIRINNEFIPKDRLCEYAYRLYCVLSGDEKKDSYSQFEISTAIAFMYFSDEKVDVVVLETGIGGLLDSTNVINKCLVSIIVSVAFDHMAVLGDTLTEIATQKAGIIKKDCPCVLSCCNKSETISVVRKKAEEMNSSLVIPEKNDIQLLSEKLVGSEFRYKGNRYHTAMAGKHQVRNAVTVIEAMDFLKKQGYEISDRSIRIGLSTAKVCARTEIINTDPLIILDGCHNPDGMKALSELLSGIENKNIYAVVGMLKNKNIKESIKQIVPYINQFYCLGSFYNNSESSDDLAKLINSLGKSAEPLYNLSDTISIISKLKKDDVLIVCGSLYLVSELRSYFIK